MTRGEATDFLEKCRYWFVSYTSEKEKWNEAIDMAIEALTERTGEWIPVSDIRRLQDIVYLHIDSLEGTRNIVEAGMLSAWKEVAEYVDGMLGEDGEEE